MQREAPAGSAQAFVQGHGRPRGRPPLAERRPTLNMRIDPDVLAALKATGPGWQTRINALLREAVAEGRLVP